VYFNVLEDSGTRRGRVLAKRLFIEPIAGRLRTNEPTELIPRETAAVAVIFRRKTRAGGMPAEEEVLLIKRAVLDTDPWSGHVAFPGGRVEVQDGNFRTTAVRETQEEVGIDLESDAKFLGYMEGFHARTRTILVVPSVFVMTVENAMSRIAPSPEVFSYRWTSFRAFLRRGNRSSYTIAVGESARSFPAYQIEDYMIWGLTERVIATLVDYARQA
jgi:8-oxo-dGTP pyrophosphatase MutT (NUDIX family)